MDRETINKFWEKVNVCYGKFTKVEIGKMFGVTGSHISNICAGRIWKNA